ncbi:MAG: DoxX family protein [Cytophagales bacterium]|nr:DoxX family protein [Cytophagales bacterium]
MKSLGFVGKLIFALVMAFFGINHLMKAEMMAGMVPDYMPAAVVIVYLTGVALIAAAVALLIGKKAQLAMTLLGVMLLLIALMIHLPGGEASMPMLLKDLGLAGAAWFISAHVKD